jgi:thiol-disulfide isomerase/thioredoxin
MNKYIYGLIGLAFVGGVVWLIMTPGKPSKYDDFAKCIASPEKKVTFFGAFWCPHCQNQKTMFGKSSKYLPYVECSTQDGRDQLPVCKDKNITTYPTWEFATSTISTTTTRIVGEVELEKLAELTQCTLPQ